MSWLGMSIPTLPGTSKKPNPQHPGAGNLERKKKEEAPEQADPKEPSSQPEEKTPGTPTSSPRKPQTPQAKG